MSPKYAAKVVWYIFVQLNSLIEKILMQVIPAWGSAACGYDANRGYKNLPPSVNSEVPSTIDRRNCALDKVGRPRQFRHRPLH